MPTIYWNPAAVGHGGIVPAGTLGIGIAEQKATDPTQIANFQNRVVASLQNLYALASGNALITALLAGLPAKRVGIVAPRSWGNGWGSNECASLGGDAGRTTAAVSMGGGLNTDVVTNALQIKMNATGHQNDWDWLAAQINAVPRFQMVGGVAAAPGNYGILGLDVQRWIQGTRPFLQGVPNDTKDVVKNAIMVFLGTGAGPGLTNGLGGHSRVYYDPRKNFNSQGARPAYVGLGHELVHAYYNMQGGQLSHSEDSTHFSTVLYEYMCVGLGPWAGQPICENQLRADDNLPLRMQYA